MAHMKPLCHMASTTCLKVFHVILSEIGKHIMMPKTNQFRTAQNELINNEISVSLDGI